MIRTFALLILATTLVRSESLLETFGSGANSFTIDFVTIGNPGNSPAPPFQLGNGDGSVAYFYKIGKYEISRSMIEKANLIGSLGINLADLSEYGGNGPNRPATGISWYEAARFVNWMNISTGSYAAYKFDPSGNFQLWNSGDAGYQSANPFRNSLARYWLPSRDEWYKAAYGNPNGTWRDLPTGTSNPVGVSEGTNAGTAVFGGQSGPADIDNAGGLSDYGTMAQGGNVWEWMESALDYQNDSPDEIREVRGGDWSSRHPGLSEETTDGHPQGDSTGTTGFRVAMVPEPSSFSLLLAGGTLLLGNRKRLKI